MIKQRGFTIIELITIIASLAIIGGWIANIWKVVVYATADGDLMKAMFILRLVGVFILPIGAVLGYLCRTATPSPHPA